MGCLSFLDVLGTVPDSFRVVLTTQYFKSSDYFLNSEYGGQWKSRDPSMQYGNTIAKMPFLIERRTASWFWMNCAPGLPVALRRAWRGNLWQVPIVRRVFAIVGMHINFMPSFIMVSWHGVWRGRSWYVWLFQVLFAVILRVSWETKCSQNNAARFGKK